jgi:SAM-dependent methyltransferase
LIDVYGKNVLVIGCNCGTDCAHFIRLGAAAVHGLDAIDEVGGDYRHRRVRYVRACAEAIPVRSNTYALVFCLATRKPIRDFERALAEMARVACPGGLIYIAPRLWDSGFGEHKASLLSGVEVMANNLPGTSKAIEPAQVASQLAFVARKRAANGTACAS